MRASRRRLENTIASSLTGLGYQPVVGPRDVPGVSQFWKRTSGLRLILAVEYARFYDESFTGSLYLGRTFTFSLFPPGYPRSEGWRRIGELLPELGSRDYWWTGFTSQNGEAFAAAVPSFEARFLAQPGLVEKVSSVEELRRRESLSQQVATTVQRLPSDLPEGLRHQPKRIPAGLPAQWLWAAEIVIEAHGNDVDRINMSTKVEWLALDAWRCAQS